jgi:hypothetical protein
VILDSIVVVALVHLILLMQAIDVAYCSRVAPVDRPS